jgi:hypothetical protein
VAAVVVAAEAAPDAPLQAPEPLDAAAVVGAAAPGAPLRVPVAAVDGQQTAVVPDAPWSAPMPAATSCVAAAAAMVSQCLAATDC